MHKEKLNQKQTVSFPTTNPTPLPNLNSKLVCFRTIIFNLARYSGVIYFLT